MRDVEGALRETVPRGKTVVLTISAPIKLATKTAAAVQELIRTRLADRSDRADTRATILGNRIRARIVTHRAAGHPKAIGFVHTAGANADILLDATQALLAAIAATAQASPAGRGAGERWLALVDRHGPGDIAIYRHVAARFAAPPAFAKVLIVFDGGSVEALTG